MNTSEVKRLKPYFFYFNSITKKEAIKLCRSLKPKDGFLYFGFKSPWGIHSRGLPKSFINGARSSFNNSNELYKAINKAFTMFYGSGVKGIIITDPADDPIGDIGVNLETPTRWALLKNDTGVYFAALDLRILFNDE